MSKNASRAEPLERKSPVEIQHLLTVGDVAAILSLSRVKVYDLIKRAGLPTLKIDGARRIHPEKLQRWIEQQTD